jgi:oxygen-dependent protoporphyrinogen oxidase
MPQYEVGHAARMAEIDDRVAAIGDLHLTGAAYRGAGLAACVTQAAATAASLTQGVPR